MNFLENIRLALSSIKASKMRTFLTMLGIIIGIAAVVTISAIGNGGKYQIQKSLEQFGTNRLMVYMNWNDQKSFSSRDYLTDRDVEAIRNIKGIEAISPIYEDYSSLRILDKTIDVILIGSNSETDVINNVEMISGRFISQQDVDNHNYSIVISQKEAKELFGQQDVLGEKVTMNSYVGPVDFTIVGVYHHEDSPFGGNVNGGRGQIYVPIKTIMRLYNQTTYYGINLKIEDRNEMDAIGQQVLALLNRLHNSQDKYMTFNLEEAMETVNGVISTITMVLAMIAGIALLVGGIGIMNIMLVTVTERIREIGVKKAIGAKRQVILLQFLTESALISLVGGIVGIVLGFAFASLASALLKMPPQISIAEVLLAAGLAIFVGILFGVYPASRASKLDPIEALRYE
ncbi:ABC transporter permease [Alkaliphilus serpentinus]|uniref:FtsX-like permease family protein n=1 Tax=Alkaliphilus serpentinus TaxID=1482731 RepID=A0A833M866_9FIRM|nr:ABC transporter permease [Alkaliphilus serpentinus]KAB3532068.1 FtsX-like permease family protein [Alkaliphilus serpentinus]